MRSLKGINYPTTGNWLPGRQLRQTTQRSGYKQVWLYCDGEAKQLYVHRVVLAAFLGESDLYVNHKNGNKADNRVENLEYVTNLENMQHASRNKLLKHGVENHKSKLTEIQVMEIREAMGTHKDIAKRFKVSRSTVTSIRSRQTWKHI